MNNKMLAFAANIFTPVMVVVNELSSYIYETNELSSELKILCQKYNTITDSDYQNFYSKVPQFKDYKIKSINVLVEDVVVHHCFNVYPVDSNSDTGCNVVYRYTWYGTKRVHWFDHEIKSCESRLDVNLKCGTTVVTLTKNINDANDSDISTGGMNTVVSFV